ncbi:MAG: hypothetical protein ACJAZ8_002478 [Planctomycetota bacterium]|jgi:hypothetical protein
MRVNEDVHTRGLHNGLGRCSYFGSDKRTVPLFHVEEGH